MSDLLRLFTMVLLAIIIVLLAIIIFQLADIQYHLAEIDWQTFMTCLHTAPLELINNCMEVSVSE